MSETLKKSSNDNRPAKTVSPSKRERELQVDSPVFSAPDSSWPGSGFEVPEEAFAPDTLPAFPSTVLAEGARAEEMFIPADDTGLVGVEYEDGELEGENGKARPAQPILTNEVDTSAPFGEDEPSSKGRFANCEIFQVAPDQRVLEQSEDLEFPLLEYAWFSAIFPSNLDEFYMVCVAGLKRRIAAGIAKKTASGLELHQVLEGIQARTREFSARQAEDPQIQIRPALDAVDIHLRRWAGLSEKQHHEPARYFRRQIFSVLTPFAVDPSHPFPYISGLSLNLTVVVRNLLSGKLCFARVKVPQSSPRLINVDTVGIDGVAEGFVESESGTTFVILEDVIRAHLGHLFPGAETVEARGFRVTRDEDLKAEEDDAESLLTAMEEEPLRRKFGLVVHLEVEETISKFVLDFLAKKLEIQMTDAISLPAPLDLTLCNELHELDLTDLKYPKYTPVTAAGLAEFESARVGDIFARARDHDVLLHHPYDSSATLVQTLITQAACDPNVLVMKQISYRTPGDSPIVSALIGAAQSGKQVVAIVEIKAHFDEEANTGWARKLERVGAHVIYGMVGLKTHCKLSFVIRQESEGLHRYCHIGTGNYHPKTTCGYEDLSLLTCDCEVAQDLTHLFNQPSGYAPRLTSHRLLVVPLPIRDGLTERIQHQIVRKKVGEEAWIGIKVSSVAGEAVIDAPYRASQAGVLVDVQVRGVCATRAGVPGLSENIRVRLILGRYLEHPRIYALGPKDEEEVWIGSADLMHRNFDRCVEALVGVADPRQVSYLAELVRRGVSPKTSSWASKKHGE